AVQLRNDLAHGLSGAGGRGNNVAGSGTAAPPVLQGSTVQQLLGGGDGMDSGHQAFHDTELVVQHLGNGGQAVGGAGGVGHEGHVRGVLVVVDTHDEHGGVVLGGGAHHHVLGAGIDVTLAQVLGQVLASALADILRAHGSPGNVLHVHGGEDGVL